MALTIAGVGMCKRPNLSEDAEFAVANHAYMAGLYMDRLDYRGEPESLGLARYQATTPASWTSAVSRKTILLLPVLLVRQADGASCPQFLELAKRGPKHSRPAFSNCQHVRVFLNGHSLGKQDIHDWPHRMASPLSTRRAACHGLQTKTRNRDRHGPNHWLARIELTSDRTELQSDGQDSVIASVTLVDDKNRVVPNADQRITSNSPVAVESGSRQWQPADHDPAIVRDATKHLPRVASSSFRAQSIRVEVNRIVPSAASASLSFKVR